MAEAQNTVTATTVPKVGALPVLPALATLTDLDGEPMTQKATVAQLKAALKRSAGVFAAAAHELGVSRQAVHERVRRSPSLQRWVAEIDTTILDRAETTVIDAVVGGDLLTAKWYLERKGRGRGYATRQEWEQRLPEDQLAALVAKLADTSPAALADLRASLIEGPDAAR